MREGAKQRLAGTIVIVSLVVIFVPMIFEQQPPPPSGLPLDMPEEPEFAPRFEPESYLTPETSGIGGFSEEDTDILPLSLPDPAAGPESTQQEAITLLPPVVEAFDESRTPQPAPAPPPVSEAAPEPEPAPRTPPPSAPPVQPGTPVVPQPQTSERLGSWVIQVASLGTPEGASELESHLRIQGYSAFVEQAVVGGKRYYRVRVGPMLERDDAERTATMLREREQLDTLIQRYP